MWFIGVEVEQETSAPPPKKILDPPLGAVVRALASLPLMWPVFKSRRRRHVG